MAEIESCNKQFWIYNKICLDLRNIGVDIEIHCTFFFNI